MHLYRTIVGTSGRDVLIGTPGDDIIVGGIGADTLSGGLGVNFFAYRSIAEAGDTITDFVPGRDRIDLRTLLSGLGVRGATAVANGFVRISGSGSETRVLIDADGFAGRLSARVLLTLRNVDVGSFSLERDVVLP
jgi:uncharacterized protein